MFAFLCQMPSNLRYACVYVCEEKFFEKLQPDFSRIFARKIISVHYYSSPNMQPV
jgi:hypothetical protein